MPEMNSVSRFFVNFSASRRAARAYRWLQRAVPIPRSARCLEVGCGNGALAARIIEGFQPALYVATDLDPRQVEEARRAVEKRYPTGSPAVLVLRPADMLHLSDPDASFDVVLAFVAIHHASPTHRDFSRVPDALSEFRRVLRPGGLLVYEEIFHQEPIRKWLTDHGFSVGPIQRRWRSESVVARKSVGGAAESPPSSVPRPV
jgi:ubiquinone/menaquinone biosynthesis C-methylase UbiE